MEAMAFSLLHLLIRENNTNGSIVPLRAYENNVIQNELLPQLYEEMFIFLGAEQNQYLLLTRSHVTLACKRLQLF